MALRALLLELQLVKLCPVSVAPRDLVRCHRSLELRHLVERVAEQTLGHAEVVCSCSTPPLARTSAALSAT